MNLIFRGKKDLQILRDHSPREPTPPCMHVPMHFEVHSSVSLYRQLFQKCPRLKQHKFNEL
jgi:hypothetical protein